LGSTFPCACSSSRGGKSGTEMYFFTSSYNAKLV
jgi:hypothetical protein